MTTFANSERARHESELVDRVRYDWRAVEPLAALGTIGARDALQRALTCGDPAIELAVLRYAPRLVDISERLKTIVQAIEHADLVGGLSRAIDEAAVFHPPPLLFAIHRALLQREGSVAVLLAGLLCFIHGHASQPFDWEQQPIFLRFETNDPDARAKAYLELCATLSTPPIPGVARNGTRT